MFCKVIVLLFMRFEQNNVSRVVKKIAIYAIFDRCFWLVHTPF